MLLDRGILLLHNGSNYTLKDNEPILIRFLLIDSSKEKFRELNGLPCIVRWADALSFPRILTAEHVYVP